MKRDNRRMMSGAPSRVLLIAVAAACSAAALASVADQNLILTTYAAASPAAAVAFFGSGLGLLAAGCLAASDRATGSPWALCILAAIAWLAPALVGWEAGPPLVRSIGMSLAPLLLPVLVHLLRTVPPEQLNAPVRRTMVGAVYGIAAIASVGLALTTDPFGDLHCWSNCTDNAFLVFPDQQLAGVIETAWLWATVAVGFLAVLAATWQLLTSRTVARGLGLTVAVPAVLAVGLEAAYAAVLLRNPAEDPEQNPFEWIFFLRALAAAALAAGVVMYVLQCRHRRTALVKLIHELEASPDAGALTASLSRSFGDDSLKVAYWLPREGRFVWPSGQPVRLEGNNRSRAMTSIVRRGEQVAVISHQRGTVDDEALRRQIGPAALLAIDNERLGAELRAQLEDLRASRLRIVTAADAARRRIERDLHDGAQQRLLAVLFELRLARQDCDDIDDRSAALEEMIRSTQQGLAELRELAQGIFPAILDESGLGTALGSLADQAIVPVSLDSIPDGRLPATVERTAYLVVTEALATVAEPGVGILSVHVYLNDEILVVEVEGAGVKPTEYLADRIGAGGGVLTHRSGVLRAKIPCG